MTNIVYIGTSLDGMIADQNGGLDWLHCIPNPDNDDLGFAAFQDSIDAIVMGRTTFEVVMSFGGEWLYTKPVFVLSNTLNQLPESVADKVELLAGSVTKISTQLQQRDFHRLYIDGGQVVQQFLAADAIDEMIITQLPIVLGGGTRLFGDLDAAKHFELVSSEVLLGAMVKSHYRKVKN
ncbi:dihydrofolate reductase family protein [Ferrimonas aestuarii]|uniref:Dihydrofolate reductase n=1 Tax=Ferrimonas aestuarii TaxID=2569539 RepID=A0A4U1BKL4_9GAMM|nr:dihydrofolate reductase family protein [Ferrimonas aestuarii]TKB52756.1 dihydrofolate reductase [Ferrimonas aestuarii]